MIDTESDIHDTDNTTYLHRIIDLHIFKSLSSEASMFKC